MLSKEVLFHVLGRWWVLTPQTTFQKCLKNFCALYSWEC